MSTEAIAATTDAATSGSIVVPSGSSIQVFTGNGLTALGTEAVRLERSDGSNWYPVIDQGKRGVVLSPTIKSQTVNGPGTFRLVKTATVDSVAVFYDS